MAKYIIHHLNHAGWSTGEVETETLEEAIRLTLNSTTASFLDKEYKDKYRIECDDPKSEYPRYRVIWDNEEMKEFLFRRPLKKGDVWWSERYELGAEDDCHKCGGTGVNHYNPFVQCWNCGDSTMKGRGSGKIL